MALPLTSLLPQEHIGNILHSVRLQLERGSFFQTLKKWAGRQLDIPRAKDDLQDCKASACKNRGAHIHHMKIDSYTKSLGRGLAPASPQELAASPSCSPYFALLSLSICTTKGHFAEY